jgi:hypothetical protein
LDLYQDNFQSNQILRQSEKNFERINNASPCEKGQITNNSPRKESQVRKRKRFFYCSQGAGVFISCPRVTRPARSSATTSFYDGKPADTGQGILPNPRWFIPAVIIMLIIITAIFAHATPPATLMASWYSIESLKKEGTWKRTKGVMANGEKFNDGTLTCATRIYPLGTRIRITCCKNSKTVLVRVTDRIGKRFAKKRIDLSRLAFSRIAELEDGLVAVKVERIK